MKSKIIFVFLSILIRLFLSYPLTSLCKDNENCVNMFFYSFFLFVFVLRKKPNVQKSTSQFFFSCLNMLYVLFEAKSQSSGRKYHKTSLFSIHLGTLYFYRLIYFTNFKWHNEGLHIPVGALKREDVSTASLG